MQSTQFFLSILGLALGMNNSPAQKTSKWPGQKVKNGKCISTEIEIHAPAQKISEILVDFEKYPEWNPFIQKISGPDSGKLKILIVPPGKSQMGFSPKVLKWEKDKELRWIGIFGIPHVFDGEHVFRIEDLGNGTCRFLHYERFRGILVPFLDSMLNKNTKAGFELMNQKLKERAEACIN